VAPAARFGGLVRFAAGTAGSALAGLLVFREAPLDFARPASQSITMGALASAILALVRTSRPAGALRLVGAFALLQLGVTWTSGLGATLAMAAWSAFTGLGMFLVAVVFDRMARGGVRIGKFLVSGPLLGGIYFAASPLLSFVHPDDLLRALWMNAFLGIVIGDGVGLGVEAAELAVLPREPHAVAPRPAAGAAADGPGP
jgi:hypothetical protein